jgi:hypothetical protein
MNIDEMQQQYHGAVLPQLIHTHMKVLSKDILPQAIRGTFIGFDEETRPKLDSFTDSYINNWCSREAMEKDLGDLFSDTIGDINNMLDESDIDLPQKLIFDLFHIMAMKLALKAHTDEQVSKVLETK